MKNVTIFGITKKSDSFLKLTRDGYAEIDNRVHANVSGMMMKYYLEHPEERKKYYSDTTFSTYTDKYCVIHQINCLYNYDLNMQFFNRLQQNEFEHEVQRLLRCSRRFKEIIDLNECEGKEGIYVMVLDVYKQMYIGQSVDIKKRIMTHWSKKKEFDKLLFGSKETSRLSIDCFGALDTTRIFVLIQNYNLDYLEKKIIEKVHEQFLLNRVGGGIGGTNNLDVQLSIFATKKNRKLIDDEFNKRKYKEEN